MNMNTTGKIIAAAAVGIAAGAVAGLLLAPRTGKDTRGDIRKKGGKLADKVRENIEEGRQQLSSLRENLETRIRELNREEQEAV
jgi:gas vesicle protein